MSTVLIVDDALTDRELAGQVVRACGKKVQFASNGLEALEKARETQPDLILMDVVMPEQDGFATCRQLKLDPETASIPVVLVTSKGEASDRFWGERQGAAAYLVKPYRPTDLTKIVEELT